MILLLVCSSKKEPFTNTNIVKEIPDFLTPEECDIIIELSKPNLVNSLVYSDKEDQLNTTTRKSMQCWLKDEVDSVIKKVSDKTAELTGFPTRNQESLQVVSYTEGGFFNPHYDACRGDEKYCHRMNNNGGPRYMTLLIYLNDDYDGGETLFPKLNYKTSPKKGNAVLFYDTDDNGKILDDSLHGGNPVSNGMKWVCNKWVHKKEFSL